MLLDLFFYFFYSTPLYGKTNAYSNVLNNGTIERIGPKFFDTAAIDVFTPLTLITYLLFESRSNEKATCHDLKPLKNYVDLQIYSKLLIRI